MVLGSQLENSTWIEAIEALDTVVVTDELEAGTRYFWARWTPNSSNGGARPLLYSGVPRRTIWPPASASSTIFNMIEQYKGRRGHLRDLRNDAEYGHDKLFSIRRWPAWHPHPGAGRGVRRKRERADEDTGRGFPGDGAKPSKSATRQSPRRNVSK